VGRRQPALTTGRCDPGFPATHEKNGPRTSAGWPSGAFVMPGEPPWTRRVGSNFTADTGGDAPVPFSGRKGTVVLSTHCEQGRFGFRPLEGSPGPGTWEAFGLAILHRLAVMKPLSAKKNILLPGGEDNSDCIPNTFSGTIICGIPYAARGYSALCVKRLRKHLRLSIRLGFYARYEGRSLPDDGPKAASGKPFGSCRSPLVASVPAPRRCFLR